LNDVIVHYLWEIVCAVVFALAVTFLYQMYNGAYGENEYVYRSIRSGQNVREAEILDPDAYWDDDDLTGATVFYEIIEAYDPDFQGEIEVVKADGTSSIISQSAIADAKDGKTGGLMGWIHVTSYYLRDIYREDDGSVSRIVYTERE
jgi:hypothetical protein